MPGGSGSFDIYMVEINEDGTFGTPQNLGAGVNTAHREQFPFISENDVLYFTSDGHQGFGNLDIYRTEGDFSEVENLGADFYGYIKHGKKSEYFINTDSCHFWGVFDLKKFRKVW